MSCDRGVERLKKLEREKFLQILSYVCMYAPTIAHQLADLCAEDGCEHIINAVCTFFHTHTHTYGTWNLFISMFLIGKNVIC